MSTHRATIVFDVDDEYLSAHDGDKVPPPNDVAEWIPSDLHAAIGLGVVEISEATFEDSPERLS
jgi:hypothetical protein